MEHQLVYQDILSQLKRQLYSFFIDVDMSVIESKIAEAYQRCMISIAASSNKYLNPNGVPLFRLEHSGCWSIFLYYLSNSLKNQGGGAEQIYYLNKILHGIEWYCEVELPTHFMVEHPVGSVLGRAKYGDYMLFYQGVTIGGNISLRDGNIVYPVLGDYIVFLSNAKVLGNAHVGNNVIFSANSYVINEDIPDNCIVFGSSPNLIIKRDKECIEKWMKRIWRQ